MKSLAILIGVFLSLGANAAYDCTVTIFLPGAKQPAESKLELRPNKKDKYLFSAEKDGYNFEVLRNESDPNQIEKLIVKEMATTHESVSSFVGWKAENPSTTFMAAVLEGDSYHLKGARMICKIKL
jgi:hypothetical protein